MRVGIALPRAEADGQPLQPTSLAQAAGRIEAAGFESAWVFDAIGRGFLLPDPLTSLAVAAGATRAIELGTGVLQVPLRHPVELAQRVLTTQLISGNRLLLGVGAGSTAGDFEALDLPFDARFRRLHESLVAMRALWAGQKVGTAVLTPIWPSVAGGPPVLIGSWAGGKWIERAAREYDGWVASGARSSWQKVRDGIKRFRDLGGKRAVLTNVVVDLAAARPTSEAPDDPLDLRCPPPVAADRLRRVRELGYDDVVLVTRGHAPSELAALRALVPRPAR